MCGSQARGTATGEIAPKKADAEPISTPTEQGQRGRLIPLQVTVKITLFPSFHSGKLKPMAFLEGNTVGIDLGTTYSALAQVNAEGQPVTIHNSDDKPITPSVVLLGEDGHVLVGRRPNSFPHW